MQRKRLTKQPAANGGGLYFEKSGVKCISTGCLLLNCAISGPRWNGGWARGRFSNIVGDKAVGKTLLAIEACANFAKEEPKGLIFYREAEAAFDVPYAEALGLPVDRIDFGPDGADTVWDTIEDIFDDLDHCLDLLEKKGAPGLYIIDSLDAISSKAELKRKIDEGSFGLEKQKMMSRLFRERVRRMRQLDMTMIIISQVRAKIGVTFGEKVGRSGGKALDFYASQIVWLSYLSRLTATRGGVKRTTGVRIKAQCKKNKIALPFGEAEFIIRFGYGVEDIEASVEWLKSVKALDRLGVKDVDKYLDELEDASAQELAARADQVKHAVLAAWTEIEKRFAPARKKYA